MATEWGWTVLSPLPSVNEIEWEREKHHGPCRGVLSRSPDSYVHPHPHPHTHTHTHTHLFLDLSQPPLLHNGNELTFAREIASVGGLDSA